MPRGDDQVLVALLFLAPVASIRGAGAHLYNASLSGKIRPVASSHRHQDRSGRPIPHPLSSDSLHGRLGRSIRPPLKLCERHSVLHSRLPDLDSTLDASPGDSSTQPPFRNAVTDRAHRPRTVTRR